MNERLLKEALGADCREAGDPAMSARLARLRPEVARAAAKLKARQEARRQNLMFFACACAFAVAAGFAVLDWSRGGHGLPGDFDGVRRADGSDFGAVAADGLLAGKGAGT